MRSLLVSCKNKKISTNSQLFQCCLTPAPARTARYEPYALPLKRYLPVGGIMCAENFSYMRREFLFCALTIFTLCAKNFSALRIQFFCDAGLINPPTGKLLFKPFANRLKPDCCSMLLFAVSAKSLLCVVAHYFFISSSTLLISSLPSRPRETITPCGSTIMIWGIPDTPYRSVGSVSFLSPIITSQGI